MPSHPFFRRLAFLFLLTVGGAVSGCSPLTRQSAVGTGPCSYRATPGRATIVSVTSAPSDGYNCKQDPVTVVFDFTPDGPSPANPVPDRELRFTVGAGLNPPRAYILANGLTVGSMHPCIRKNLVSGTCTPVLFEFTDVELTDYGSTCFAIDGGHSSARSPSDGRAY